MYEDLLSSKNFCILPFVHAHIATTGNSQPCCINFDVTFGNVNELGVDRVYSKNNQKLIDFRKNMLQEGSLPTSCFRCGIPESYGNDSYRLTSNKTYGNLLKDVDDILNNENIYLWDVRFSNLCNLKCRSCGPDASSRIAEEQDSDTVLIKSFDQYSDFFELFIKNIEHVTEFYFCGGEPLIMEEHYRLLDLLIQHKKFDVKLRYNSNLTALSLKDRNVIDYWKQFKNIKISASIDAGWEQLSYVRHGADWNTILKNLTIIRNEAPHIELIVGSTVSILNAFHVLKMYKYLVSEGLIQSHEMYFMPVRERMSLCCLPEYIKKNVENYWLNELTDIKDQNVIISALALLKEMNSSTGTVNELKQFIDSTKKLDKRRNENFVEVFPELKDLLYYG